jgi:hypothetical protein
LDEGNGAQRQWRRYESGESARETYAATVSETCSTYATTEAALSGCR